MNGFNVKQQDIEQLKAIAETVNDPLFTKEELIKISKNTYDHPLIDYSIKELVKAKLAIWDTKPWYGDLFLKELVDYTDND